MATILLSPHSRHTSELDRSAQIRITTMAVMVARETDRVVDKLIYLGSLSAWANLWKHMKEYQTSVPHRYY
ncbi:MULTISPECIES: hypothetical protein [unclassified Novosphingobium]|uniref:hypothetical protein n=1 Tax=unclassified Novosphingobium TaxID=2644732 RepID=UPI00105EF857|nr:MULTISPECIES: hypothetical protein [unclassified Novosphingobium]